MADTVQQIGSLIGSSQDAGTRRPQHVVVVDGTTGTEVAVGLGVEYVEDAAAAANPVGKITMLVRQDTPAGKVTTDGDNVAQGGTNFGAAYVTVLDSGGTPVSVGLGTQYTEGDTDSTITGTAALTEGPSNTLTPLQSNAAKELLVATNGAVAHDAVDSGNPIKVGGIAVTAAPAAVSALDRVNAIFDLWGRLYTRHGNQAPVASTFTGTHVPATNVQASKVQASAGSGKRNVCTGFTVTITAGASAPTAAAPITVQVVDGDTGGTTYLWRTIINLPAVAGAQVSIVRGGLWLVGSQATKLTIEFSAAGGTNTYESVSIEGVVVEE